MGFGPLSGKLDLPVGASQEGLKIRRLPLDLVAGRDEQVHLIVCEIEVCANVFECLALLSVADRIEAYLDKKMGSR